MHRTSLFRRPALWLAALAIAGACTGVDKLVGPSPVVVVPGAATADVLPAGAGPITISQVYGGGGNTGATIKNDYIELYNAGTVDVDLTGWSVQYAPTTSTSWQSTTLSGTIRAGHYYLIQEAAGNGGTVALTPDLAPATGIAMAAGAGKVALLTTTTLLSGSAAGTGTLGGATCPNNAAVASVLDFVGYGTGTTCFEGTGPTGTISATNATFRKSNGAQDTNNNANDFTVAVAAPRNGGTAPVNTPVAAVAPATASVAIGATTTFTASATLNGLPLAVSSMAWSSSNTAVATIDAATGVATAVGAGSSTITATMQTASGQLTATATLTVSAPSQPAAPGLVISQVYGGGGNSGATLKNDFIELYNGGTSPVNLAGWSVQYSSPTQTSWTLTALVGTVAPGHYFLIQESAGAAGTTDLPTPDYVPTTDILSMGATAGKIALVRTISPLTGTCPATDASVQDFVGYGAANCFEGAAPMAVLTNTTAGLRKDGGRQDTNVNSADFDVAAPAPRNSGSPRQPPLSELAAAITPANSAALIGTTVNYVASAQQFGAAVPITAAAWTSSNPAAATIDPTSGVATALAIGSTTISVTATTASGIVTATTTLTVSSAPAIVTVTPAIWSMKVGQTKAFAAAAVDDHGAPTSSTYSWTSSNTSVATINATTGLATGLSFGTVTITATSANNVVGTASLNVTVGNISVQARTDPLPVGFQTQFFLNNGSTDSHGTTVGNADMTWTSSDSTTVSVNANTGVVTALKAGSTQVIATSKTDGIASGFSTLITSVATVSPSARIGHNTELGVPTDADPSDDIIVARRQYTLSYNASHAGPNWVSWNLDATHKGSQARCNCFTADTALTRLGVTAYETNDWINGGTWSRGHMSPSADWADSDGDNAPTFFLSNMIPQNQTANAGAWGDLENYLRTLATGSTEIYIVAGPIFTPNRDGTGLSGFGFMTGTGHIAVPDSIWKVAIVVPDARSASGITAPGDVQVIAVNMENSAVSVGNWSNYATTIEKIQKSTGYDLLALLPENVQCKLEVRNCVPSAHITGAGLAGGNEGQTLTFDASTSSDGDNDALSYHWSINGQAAGTAASLSYTFANNGTFTLALSVDDGHGGTSATSATVTVLNVAPSVAAFASASIAEGGTFATTGSFADPGADHWSATVDYGDGSGAQPIALAADKSFSLSHTYADNGTYSVVVQVTETDPEAAAGAYTGTVTVTNVAPTVATFAGATILRGENYAASGSFTDPGADTWTATVKYGDGSGTNALPLSGTGFSLAHTYVASGAFTVAVQVTDKDGGAGTRSALVTVLSADGGVAALQTQVSALAGRLNNGQVNSLTAKLNAASKSIGNGNLNAASGQLNAFINEVQALVSSGRLDSDTASSLIAYAQRVLASMGV